MGVRIPAGTTNPSLPIYCRALTGAALTGKAAEDFTELWYMREGGAKVDVDPAGIVEVAGGEYRQTFPTAAAAAGANYVTVGGAVNGGVVLGIPIGLEASVNVATIEGTDATDAIQAAAAAAITAAGLVPPGGDYTQTVTVTAGTPAVAVQNATVYIIDVDGTIVDKQTTNASGVATPSADAGTYTLKTVKPGYATSNTSITVTAATARAVTLTEISITPPVNPTDCSAAWVCLNDADAPVAGVTVRARPDTDATGDGYVWSGHTRSAISVAGTGLATIALPQGSVWWIRAGSGEEVKYTVPATATDLAGSIRGGKRDTY